jgi:hypothetical protein
MCRSVTSRLRRACQSGISATQTAGSSRVCANPRLRSHASMHGRLCVYSGCFFSGSRSSHCASDGSAAAASATSPAPLLRQSPALDAGAANLLWWTEGARETTRSELDGAMDMMGCLRCFPPFSLDCSASSSSIPSAFQRLCHLSIGPYLYMGFKKSNYKLDSTSSCFQFVLVSYLVSCVARTVCYKLTVKTIYPN